MQMPSFSYQPLGVLPTAMLLIAACDSTPDVTSEETQPEAQSTESVPVAPSEPADASDDRLTVYVAEKIITMDSGLPEATAVAVLGGRIAAVGERVSAEQALRMVTLDAAYVLGMDDRIGSIEPGKHADFTVLEQNPLEVPPEPIRGIGVWGTVFAGDKYPAPAGE